VQKALGICAVILLIVGASASAQQRGNDAGAGDYVGTWAGTWEGGGSGGFVLTLEKRDGGKLGGNVSVTGEPTYEATLKTVSFEGNKMTATYDFPPDPQIGIVLTATFEGTSASGTWAARQSGGNDVANGTWTVKRK
jgi:hypothetical protein